MANNAIRLEASSSRQRGVVRRSGATYSRSSSPARSAFSTPRAVAASCVELRNAARTPASCIAATWSCISAISGDTITPVPLRMSEGTW